MLVLAYAAVASMTSCSDDNDSNWNIYKDWREANVAYYDSLKYVMTPEGGNYFTTIVPPWNSGAEVLIRYLNDRSLTVGNLSPMSNSTVKVKYLGKLYNGVGFDSSYTATDSAAEFQLTQVVAGWNIALQYMRVGDSARIVIPYLWGYGTAGSGSIPPYSTLVFDIKLLDIPGYEIKL